jgi:hypothetical protein
MSRRIRETSGFWTTVARVSVCLIVAGAVADAVGWRMGLYVCVAAFMGLMLSLQYP